MTSTSDSGDDTDLGSDPWTLLGRCVDENGGPVVGVQIVCALSSLPDAQGESRPLSRVEADSDELGHFALESFVDGESDARVRLTAAGYVPLSAMLRRPQAGETVEMGDVVLREAISVDGSVTDDQGNPVEGARVQFVLIDLTAGPTSNDPANATAPSMLTAFSDALGRFVLEDPAWPGEWFIGVEYCGALIAPRNVQLEPGTGAFDLRIVVERPDPEFSITGRVVDDSGQPVAGARLSMIGHGFIGRGLTGADGSFTAHRAGPMPDRGRTTMQVDVDHESGLYDWNGATTHEGVRWGDRDLAIVLDRRASRSVLVVDEQGEPVEDYALFAFTDYGGGDFAHLSRVRVRGYHPGGRSRVTGLRLGHQAVLVLPSDSALAPSAWMEFDVVAGGEEADQRVICPDAARWTLNVLTKAGSPVSDSVVEVVQALSPSGLETTSRVVPASDCDRVRGVFDFVSVASGVTDGQGRLSLRLPPGAFSLRIRGDSHVDLVEPVEIARGDSELSVFVDPGATVTGRVGPPALLDSFLSLEGSSVQIELDPLDQDAPSVGVPVEEEGRFSVSGLAPGDYRALVRLDYVASFVNRAEDRWLVEELSLRTSEERSLVVDLESKMPGRVSGLVLVDGEPLSEMHCFLERDGDGLGPRLRRVGTDREGRFESLCLPGAYTFWITMPSDPGPAWVRMPVPGLRIDVAPGAVVPIEARVDLRRVELRLVDGDGNPLSERLLRVVHSGYHLPGRLITDANGLVIVDPAPPGPFQIRVGQGEDAVEVGPFDLPIGRREGRLDVTLPN
ncbi:MAG: carboxypeptidase-like regulatory domain-containing protein [Planctomycetota bacterium]